MPSAVLNSMETSGPISIQVRITSDRPASKATTGTSHIQEMRRCFLRVTSGASTPLAEGGGVCSAMSVVSFLGLCGILPGRRGPVAARRPGGRDRSEEHTSELQSLMRISYAVFCLKKKTAHH